MPSILSTLRTGIIMLLLPLAAIPAIVDDSSKIIIKPRLNPEEIPIGTRISSEPGIGLAISGGGARGLAVIGVLRVLEREKIKINFIAGVSMGSIIGGLYSCGYSAQEIERILLGVNWGDLFSPGPLRNTLLTTQKGQAEKSLFKLRFQSWKPVIPQAMTSAQKLSRLLENLTSRAGIRSSISFDYLNPPLRIICTDLLSGEKVVISSGNISEAMRASAAVPVAFTPVEIGGRLLVDGGLVDPIPVDVVKKAGSYPIIAVDVSSRLLPYGSISDVVDIADQTTTIMSIDKKREALANADICIAPDLAGRRATDFSNPRYLVAAGEKAAEEALPAIRDALAGIRDEKESSTAYRINRIEYRGLKNMPQTFFVSGFTNDSSMTPDDISLNLEKAYASGYLQDAWAEIMLEGKGAALTYYLPDNQRIATVEIRGSDAISQDELYGLIMTRSGMVLNRKTLDEDRKRLEEQYIKAGNSLVRVRTVLDTATACLYFDIDEGIINKIEIEGANKTRDWVITRHIPFKVGDRFHQKQAERAIDEIFGTELFETAKLIARPDSAGITLVVKVREKPYNYIRGGGRFDLEYGTRAFVDLVADNVFGGGQEIFVSTKLGEKVRSIALNFHSDRIFKSLFTGSLRVDYGELKQNRYIEHKYEGYIKQISHGIELTPGRQLPQLGTISLVGMARQYSWDEPGKSERQEFSKIALGIRSLVDNRDAISFPERGKYHSFEIEIASNLHDEKKAYTRFETMLEAYYRLTKRLNFHPKFTVGASSDIMPFFDEFSLGGLNSFLGLYDNEFLGDKMIIGSFELRQRIGDRTYIMTRYNAGNIWNQLETVKLSKMLHGGGIGAGLKTPIGPLQLWYGRTSDGLDAFYFNLGYDW